MPRRGLNQFALGLDVEHTPHFLTLTPFTMRVIIRILVIDSDFQNIVRQQVLKRGHRVVPEDQLAVHVGA